MTQDVLDIGAALLGLEQLFSSGSSELSGDMGLLEQLLKRLSGNSDTDRFHSQP